LLYLLPSNEWFDLVPIAGAINDKEEKNGYDCGGDNCWHLGLRFQVTAAIFFFSFIFVIHHEQFVAFLIIG
jgi:hypothetical protein